MRELIKNVWKICAWRASKMRDFHAKCMKIGRSDIAQHVVFV